MYVFVRVVVTWDGAAGTGALEEGAGALVLRERVQGSMTKLLWFSEPGSM